MKIQYLLLPLALCTASAQADILSGRVLDGSAVPVAGANLDVIDVVTGTDMALANDGTDASGLFAIDVPAGIYTVLVTPPAGMASLVGTFENVVVVGPTDIGDLTLEDGRFLSGTVLLPGALPATGANLDVELAIGGEYLAAGDTTDAAGMFQMVVPTGELALQVRPETLTAITLAPLEVEVPAGTLDVNVGSLQLVEGHWVTLTVQNTLGMPVASADLDVFDATLGTKLYTPGDNTDTLGFVDVVVPTGTFLVEVQPRFLDRLVATTVGPVTVSAPGSLGSVQLEDGFVLSGTVTDAMGAVVADVDVDAFDASTGLEVTLFADNSDATGAYAVIVPASTLDLVFTPEPGLGNAITSVAGVVVNGDTVQDVQLGSQSGPTLFCDPAQPNSTGGPVTLAGSDFSGPGVFHLDATGGPANQFGAFVVAANNNPTGIPVSQGLLCLAPPFGRYTSSAGATLNSIGRFDTAGIFQNLFGTSTTGTGFDVPATLPNPPGGTITAGTTWHFQLWYRDIGGASNFSNGISVSF